MKALSPVIAAVITIALVIAISIAIGLWVTRITSSFTRTEKLEIINTFADLKTDPSGNKYLFIHMLVKNTGTKPATIDNIFVNGKPGKIISVSYENNKFIPPTGLTINPGEEKELIFILTSTGIVKEVKYTTREDPEPDKNEPYMSYYPAEIIGSPGDNITITVIVKQDNDQSLNGVDIVIIDENENLIIFGNGLSLQ